MSISDRIEELANLLKDNSGDNADIRKELKDIIIPKVKRINKLFILTGLIHRCFEIDGFDGNIVIENDYDWDGTILDSKTVNIVCRDDIEYIDLQYFNKSDEELFEIFKKESIKVKQYLLDLAETNIVELKKDIEEINNLKL